ncbi:MAG: RNA polymerase sigma factor [Myxococcaceae bacterium]
MAELDMTQARTARVDVRALYVSHAAALRSALARLCDRAEADDLLQELFVVAVRRHDELARADSPVSWLYGVAVKLAAGRRRRLSLRRFIGLSAAEELAAPARSIEEREQLRLLHRALDALPGKFRDVLVLFELQGLSGEEVGAALGIAVPTVWTRLSHARKALSVEVTRLGGGA